MHILLAITGASGSVYAIRLLEELAKKQLSVTVVLSDNGVSVTGFETGVHCDQNYLQSLAKRSLSHITLARNTDLWACASSGSSAPDAMVIVPCSMGTIGRIANGISGTLIERAADVMLKERKPLIVVPRETPFSSIHLTNMLTLTQAGAEIIPACPGFYHRPTQLHEVIDFMVGKILDRLKIEHSLVARWQGNQ